MPIHILKNGNEDEDEQLRVYKGKLKSFYRQKISPKIGDSQWTVHYLHAHIQGVFQQGELAGVSD